MACLATQGRLNKCSEFQGGLFKVWFANYGTINPTIDASNLVTSLSGATLYEYELTNRVSKLTQELTGSKDNGTTAVTQTLTLNLYGGDAATNNELLLLAYNKQHVFVQYNYGDIVMVGKDFGAKITTSTHDTGANLGGEPFGYTLTIVAEEKGYANYLSGSTLASPFVGMTVAPAIVKGT